MSKPEFDFSKQAKVPEEWIENALAIPSLYPKEPVIPAFPYRIVAAVSAVLITALGLSTFFLFGNKNQPPFGSPRPESTAAATHSADSSLPGIFDPTAPDMSAASSIPPQEETGTDGANSATVTASENATGDPTAPFPSESATVPATEAPIARPTTPATVPPATQPHTVAPQPTVTQTDPPVEPPSEASSPSPNPPITDPEIVFTVSCRVPEDYSQEPEDVSGGYNMTPESDPIFYCRVYMDGYGMLGSSSLNSPSHLAETSCTAGEYVLSYDFQNLIPLESSAAGNRRDSYTFRYSFYDQNGIVVASGTLTVTV